MRLIRIRHPDYGATRPFRSLFDEGSVDFEPGMALGPNDVVILEGGNDISPTLYGQKMGGWTRHVLEHRDKFEVMAAKQVHEAGGAIIGICRGAQLLTALAGGKLIQHVTGHVSGNHPIRTFDNRCIEASSCHHQMCAPMNVEHKLIAWSEDAQSEQYLGEKDEDVHNYLDSVMGLEPEILWYPTWRGLAIQGHPEYMHEKHVYVMYCRKLVRDLIFNKEK